jgi:basic membrane protein A
MTKSNKVGFIGGLEVPLIKKFETGFRAGVMTVNPDAEVQVTYAGSFGDPGKGKEVALSQYANGADVIYHASGGTGLGLFQAAQEKGPGFWAIGVDSDQYDLAPNNTLTSMMKQVDVAVFETIKATQAGNFKAGTSVFGLKENGVGLAPTTKNNTPQEVIDKANAYADRIIKGEFTVPSTEEELAKFTPPK